MMGILQRDFSTSLRRAAEMTMKDAIARRSDQISKQVSQHSTHAFGPSRNGRRIAIRGPRSSRPISRSCVRAASKPGES